MSPKKYLVLAKIETTQFTDSTPVAATNSILVKNLKCTPLEVETEDRALVKPYYGNSEQLLVSEQAIIEFDVEVAGAGAAGTAPKWGPLLRACAFSETISAGVDVQYSPISGTFEFLTIKAYRDGVLYQLLGAAGTVALNMEAKKLPEMHFRFIGKYTPVTDAAIPTGSDFTGFTQPKASLPANTGTLTIGGYAAKLSKFSSDLANEISHAIWINNETLAITDRKPKVNMTVEAVTVASKDYFGLVRAGTLSAFTYAHGVTGGNIVQIDAPKLQVATIAESVYENTMAYDLTGTLNPNTGNDEIKITVK